MFIQTFSADHKTEQPTIAFFEGIDAVKTVVLESLYNKERKILTIAPEVNFSWEIGPDFVEEYVSQKKLRNIKTRSLWEKGVDEGVFKQYYQDADIKMLPEVMKKQFKTTIFIYDDKILYISSKKNAYALLVTSKKHSDLMRALFEGVWLSSTKHLLIKTV